MKKLLSLVIVTSALVACGGVSKAETAITPTKKASDLFQKLGAQQLLAYATEYNTLEIDSPGTNLVTRELYKSAIKYNYTLPGFPDDLKGTTISDLYSVNVAHGNFFALGKLTSPIIKNGGEVAADVLTRWQTLGVDLGVIQTNPEVKTDIINSQALFDAAKSGGFAGKLVITGLNTSNVDLGDNQKGAAWSENKKVATFEFSEIVSAYNAGYQTQSQFGRVKLKDGRIEKRTVGYIIAAVKEFDVKTNIKNMKKANAFKLGVEAAVEDQATGTAKFVSRNIDSMVSEEKTLMFAPIDIVKYFSEYRISADYKDNDHSVVYYAGADASENLLVANELHKSSTTNSYGHKLVVEFGGLDEDDNGVGFGQTSGGAWIKGSLTPAETNVTARIYMASKQWLDDKPIHSNWIANQKYSNALAVEAVLSSLYGENKGKVDYFGKHTAIGAIAEITSYTMDANLNKSVNDGTQVIDKSLTRKIRKILFAKNIKISEIIDTFLGSGL